MVSVHFQTPLPNAQQHRKAGDDAQSSLQMFLRSLGLDDLENLSLVDDNARIHRTESYYRIELTSTAPKRMTAWCPNDPVVGSARMTKDRWGVLNKVAVDETSMVEEDTSSEFFIKKPNRRSSIDNTNLFDEFSLSPDSQSDSVQCTPKQSETKKSWDSLLRRSDSIRRTSLPSSDSAVLRQPQRGLSPIPMSEPPAPPSRAPSPTSPPETPEPCKTWKILGADAKVPSFDEMMREYELPLPEDGEELKFITTPIQSPIPTMDSGLRSSGTATSASSSASSFQRKPPTHTNSFEVTVRRSARRSSVKRRFVKMTKEDLQTRILDMLVLDDCHDDKCNLDDDDDYVSETE